MKYILLLSAAAFSLNAFGDFEAGTDRSELVGKDPAVNKLVEGLQAQAVVDKGLGCHLDYLTGHGSGEKTLVDFFVEDGINKFTVGVDCKGGEQTGDLRYEIKGRMGDGAILIESVKLN